MKAVKLLDRFDFDSDARRRAERIVERAEQSGIDLDNLSDDGLRIVELSCQRAPYLARLLGRDPTRLARVAADPYLRREKPARTIAEEVAAAIGADPDVRRALRRVRADELVRLGARELELGLDTEVGRELSRLADACFDAAIAACDRELRARHGAPRMIDDDGVERDAGFAVIAMGKLGGDELNFASDVDVIYVYASDRGGAGALSLHEYFAKLAAAATRVMSDVTDEDIVFRVDLRLRPEGGSGAIACSLDALERYYETFGRPWERQAWLKARPCAGDRALGDAVMQTLQPFVFPRVTPPTIVDEVRALDRRIKRELVRAGDGFDLKNGKGGIREIEFFVQALQLVHAGKRPQLRARGTLAALDALLFAGLVADDEHLALWRAYRWMRHAEHVLQLDAGLQTQILPDEPAPRAEVARRLGYTEVAELDRDLARHTGAAARLFATLGDQEEANADIADVLRGELPEADEADALARLGFADVTAACAELARARRRPGSPLSPGATDRAARVGATLLAEIAASADPDQALRALGDLVARRGEAWSLWRLVDEQPAVARLVGSLFGASAYLARTLVDTPEAIDMLVELGQGTPTRTRAQLAGELAQVTIDLDDPERAWSRLAAIKNRHVLRVGLADFAGALDPLAACAELTTIAEACLERALALVGDHERLAILALGKLGGRELGYAADLDVVFVYDGDEDAIVATTRIAQRLLGALRQVTPNGRLYELDTRLRPSGTQGLLVSSLAAWRRYHAEDARLWERQALTKLRAVAGDPIVGAEAESIARRAVYGAAPGPLAPIAHAIRDMRERIERELGGRDGSSRGRVVDVKTGPGGIVDIEFAAQYLQLVHGHAHAALRATGTADVLRAAAALGVAPATTLELLEQGYRFLRGLEHRLRVVHDQPIHRLPESRVELDRLARRSSFPDGRALLAHLERWQRDIRAAFVQLVTA
jgi:glutamate-ammonia-ligase adenylyltransferase